jgi:hypothetical protein
MRAKDYKITRLPPGGIAVGSDFYVKAMMTVDRRFFGDVAFLQV